MSHLLLYGGTFDPIHHGHLIPCRRARELLHADTVLLIPARVSPHKTDPTRLTTTTPEQRLAMLRLAIDNEPGFTIDPRELSRQGPSFTVDTLREFAAERPGTRLTLLIGADQLRLFATWRHIEQIMALADVAVLARPGTDLASGLEQVLKTLGREAAARIAPLETPQIDISATVIRQRAAEGLSLRYLVPDAVADYIREQGLYRSPPSAAVSTHA
jgi:nicotinate-nucleotide adenylyltransferase